MISAELKLKYKEDPSYLRETINTLSINQNKTQEEHDLLEELVKYRDENFKTTRLAYYSIDEMFTVYDFKAITK